jgi:hydrogenase/urease accessory protein HupE
MRSLRLATLLLLACLMIGVPRPSPAHLMVAQQGTINLVGDGAFMVLSVPVSALDDWDDNRDTLLSASELNAHRQAIADQIHRRLQLHDDAGPRPLQGMMMSLSPGDEAPDSPASQLVIMGRFQLDSPDRHDRALRLQTDLFGATESERSLGITVSRGPETGLIILTPQRSQKALFASGWQVIGNYFVAGLEHILSGYDHLLFLLVVLFFCASWQSVLMTLTCFTVGHAITLSISLFAGISVSPTVVEPAIAATILGMLIFEALQRRRARSTRSAVRLGLVFFCALIHGLGLASSLQDIGLDTTHRLQSLAGFNLGIEAGQIAVAMVAWTVLLGLRRAGVLPVAAIGSR